MGTNHVLGAAVPILLADSISAQGYAGRLVLRLTPGSGKVRAEVTVDAAARSAVEIAVNVALGLRVGRWDVWWTVELDPNLPASVIQGDSLGLAAAVAARAALQRRVVPAGVGFTGRIDLAGEVDAVGFIKQKAAAAAAAGIRALVVPPGSPEFAQPERIEVRSAAELFARLWPERRLGQGLRVAAALALGPSLVAVGLLEPLDLPVRQVLQGFASAPLEASETTLVLMPARETSAGGALTFHQRRARLAPLVRELVEAEVSSITLDRWLPAEDPSDEDLAAALDQASAAQVPVVMAVPWRDGPVLPASPALRQRVEAGALKVGTTHFELDASREVSLGKLVVRDATAVGDFTWHAAALTVDGWTRKSRGPRLDNRRLYVGTTSVSAPAGRVTLRAVTPPPCLLWTEDGYVPDAVSARGCEAVTSLKGAPSLRGRAAVVGVRDGSDTVARGGRRANGVDLMVAAIEGLAAGQSVRLWSLPQRVVAAIPFSLIPAVITAVSASSPRASRLALLAVALLAAASLVGLSALGFAPDVLPLALGFCGAAWAGLRVRRWRETGR